MKTKPGNSLSSVIDLVRKASNTIMDIYTNKSYQVHWKADASPVTEADLQAHQLLVAGLKQLTPDIPILSEEDADISWKIREQWEEYWLIDPLDGTKEFIDRTDEFSINVALVRNHVPVLGVVMAPVSQVLYWAEQGKKAYCLKPEMQAPKQMQVTPWDGKRALRVTASRRHGQNAHFSQFLAELGQTELLVYGSALKICLVASGEADLYPRFAGTSHWDTAAGQCILEAAGGQIADLTACSLQYNTTEILRNPSFIALGDMSIWPRCKSAVDNLPKK